MSRMLGVSTSKISSSIAFSGTLLCAAACASSNADSTETASRVTSSEGYAGTCAQQHEGTSEGASVIFCDAVHGERPFVRPPEDVFRGSKVELIGGYINYGGPDQGKPAFVTRDGQEYIVLDAAGNVPEGIGTGFQLLATLAPAMRMPSNRNLYTLYAVEGEIKDVTSFGAAAKGIRLSSVKPAIVLSGAVLDGTFREWEGEFAPSTGSFTAGHDWSKAVPFRFHVDALTPASLPFKDGKLPIWDVRGDTLADGALFRISGTVTNAKTGVTAADGRCLPRLDSQAFNALSGVPDAKFSLIRFTGMHAPGDQVMSLSPLNDHSGEYPEGMQPIYLFHPAAFLMKDPSGKWAGLNLFPHGFPYNVAVHMRPVIGGGGSCQ